MNKGMTPKGEAVKPSVNELQQIEADYDPEKDVITDRVYSLLSRAERPRRNVIGRISG